MKYLRESRQYNYNKKNTLDIFIFLYKDTKKIYKGLCAMLFFHSPLLKVTNAIIGVAFFFFCLKKCKIVFLFFYRAKKGHTFAGSINTNDVSHVKMLNKEV